MIDLSQFVDETKDITAEVEERMGPRRSKRDSNLNSPVSTVVLKWYEEQQIYDRMYEAQVYKRGHFFGYRSTAPAPWHDSEQAREEAKKPLSDKARRTLALLASKLKIEE